ncbi:hypothetical protein ACH5RR_010629 [Cinchona calisaya]|uniref:DUF4283 domain-containing protein n=1 Tax=Cinchona calisaya TaxID=153742 RepID=A0ABD3AJH1_9GENT
MAEELEEIMQRFSLSSKEVTAADLGEEDVKMVVFNYRKSLIGKIIGEKIGNFVGVENFFNQVWSFPKNLRIVEIGANLSQFHFDNENELKKALLGGPWVLDNQLLTLQKWEVGLKVGRGARKGIRNHHSSKRGKGWQTPEDKICTLGNEVNSGKEEPQFGNCMRASDSFPGSSKTVGRNLNLEENPAKTSSECKRDYDISSVPTENSTGGGIQVQQELHEEFWGKIISELQEPGKFLETTSERAKNSQKQIGKKHIDGPLQVADLKVGGPGKTLQRRIITSRKGKVQSARTGTCVIILNEIGDLKFVRAEGKVGFRGALVEDVELI